MPVKVLEPLATRIARGGDEFRIQVRVPSATPKGADDATITAAYDALLEQAQRVYDALAAFAAKEPGAALEADNAPLLSPVVRLRVRGASMSALAAAIPADVSVEISGDALRNVRHPDFDPRELAARVVAEPLASQIAEKPRATYDVIIQLDTRNLDERERTRDDVMRSLEILKRRAPAEISYRKPVNPGHSYVFARMTGEAVQALVDLDRDPGTAPAAIFRIWEDTKVYPLIVKSIATVKADAAQIAYTAVGRNIVWAVLDSGIDKDHPHFRFHQNLVGLPPAVKHRDFTAPAANAPADAEKPKDADGNDASALSDPFGHGTHVAGIIAGALGTKPPFTGEFAQQPVAITQSRNESGTIQRHTETFDAIAGMAPETTLVSYRVLDEHGTGQVSGIIEALVSIRSVNDIAGTPMIHGVNLSVGYNFDAEWFACGQSPLCVEVNRLVKSGVVVVVAAGNSGYGALSTTFTGKRDEGIGMSINDPGNAEFAITVGSVHRDSPHTFGVSYFSSKGPTGDGRRKPDLVAPGERIISCASGQSRTPTTTFRGGVAAPLGKDDYQYKEDSGTSMSAPHVSGVIAGFLSIRREYIGQPELVKKIFMDNATDLQRDVYFQGAGLVDQMRVIASV